MAGMAYGFAHSVVGQVLSAEVDAEVAELSCHLCLQLEIGGIGGPVCQTKSHQFPQLADFRFLSWPVFISSVGRISFLQLTDYLAAF